MSAITLSSFGGRAGRLRSAQTGTTTDWIQTPGWANLAIVHLYISAAGTNTILTLKAAVPSFITGAALDDTNAQTFFTSATVTAVGLHTYIIAPNATAVADQAGAGAQVVVPGFVPDILGITTTPTGSTYSTGVTFRKVA